jgi:DNA primase
MPGIDFNRLREEITMEEVLDLLGFEPSRGRGDQWYGPCPFHDSRPGRHSFSVNVAERRFSCHKCGRYGNQLELWAQFTRQSFYRACIHLCRARGRDIPWIHRW